MPAPIKLKRDDPNAVHARNLVQLSRSQMAIHIIIYAFEVYVLKLNANQITTWTPNIINSLMEIYMDKLQFNINPLPPNLYQILIDYAVDQMWTVPQLVWTAIAIHTNAMPILWTQITECFESSIHGNFGWRMPVPINRQIRHVDIVALPATWF